MPNVFDRLSLRLADPTRRLPSRVSRCSCGQPVFFDNTHCLSCASALGYLPDRQLLVALVAAENPGTWRLAEELASPLYRRCANLDTPATCNWLVEDDDPHTLCPACRLNRTTPDLSLPENPVRWAKLEAAKRRMVAQLLAFGLPVAARSAAEPEGLAFDLLGVDGEGHYPITGHNRGLITLNIEEADDLHRERLRSEMDEPYRSLLGHFRHEVGHYYWDRLVADSRWIAPFRTLFGDEREDYQAALARHYDSGPPADWRGRFISAYASVHPWEDWAECWAHYLHMTDTLGTALGFGMHAGECTLDFVPFTREALHAPQSADAEAFLAFVNAWVELAAMLNELSRNMGQPDFYPFVLSSAVVAKLYLVHQIVQNARY